MLCQICGSEMQKTGEEYGVYPDDELLVEYYDCPKCGASSFEEINIREVY